MLVIIPPVGTVQDNKELKGVKVLLGILFAGLAAACWGGAAIFARLGLQHIRTPVGTLISLIVGFLLLSVPVLMFHLNDVLALSTTAFFWFFLVGVLNFPMGRLLNYNSINLAGVARAMPILSTGPLFAVALAVVLTGERLTLPLFVGTTSIVIGIILIVTRK